METGAISQHNYTSEKNSWFHVRDNPSKETISESSQIRQIRHDKAAHC